MSGGTKCRLMPLSALHVVALARGVVPGKGSSCSYCGESPFDTHSDLSKISEAVRALAVEPVHGLVCEGCRNLLKGKPGSQPPPLRMRNVLVSNGSVSYPDTVDLRDVVFRPPSGDFVVSWAESKKKHHVLTAGISVADRQRWGGDAGTVLVCSNQHRELLVSVEQLLVFHSKQIVLSGCYSAALIVKQGYGAWDRCESVVSGYRGQRVLELFVAIARKTDSLQGKEGVVLNEADEVAVALLAAVAGSSSYRSRNGKDFWGSYFRRRINRHSHRPLAEVVSRLIDDCGSSITANVVQEVLASVLSMDDPQIRRVERSLRERSALLVAVAFDKIRADRAVRNSECST